MADVPRNPDGSFTLYEGVTLTFPAAPPAGFKVVTKDVPGGLPSNYTWLLNFGVQNSAGQFLPRMSLVVPTPSFFKGEWRSSKPRAIRIMDTGACSSRIPKGIFSRSMRTSDAPLKRRLDAQRPEGF